MEQKAFCKSAFELEINAKCIIGLYELLEYLRHCGMEKRNAKLAKISESATLLKRVHYVPQPPFEILGALHLKIRSGLYGFLFMGCREGVLKVTA